MNPNELAKLLATALDAKSAQDLRIYNVAELTVLSDYFLLATGSSNTHVQALCDECLRIAKERGIAPHHIEGSRGGGGWVLLDFGCVVVHVFLRETRAFYAVERLWADAKHLEVEDL